MSRQVYLSLMLPLEMKAWLKREARRDGRTVSDTVRRLLERARRTRGNGNSIHNSKG